jgi:hypothetical protein
MKTEFLKPRFIGPRFDQHTLPVEVAEDFAAYEEFIIELAKHLWLQEHPGRQRVPWGFEKSFNLHLEGIGVRGSNYSLDSAEKPPSQSYFLFFHMASRNGLQSSIIGPTSHDHMMARHFFR